MQVSREIKFRAWDTENKRFLKDIALEFKLNTPFANVLPSSLEFMQHTGLKDKNGKEIYEGDIVQYTTDFGRPSTIREVKWISSHGITGFNMSRPQRYAVIGNIMQNPELLK